MVKAFGGCIVNSEKEDTDLALNLAAMSGHRNKKGGRRGRPSLFCKSKRLLRRDAHFRRRRLDVRCDVVLELRQVREPRHSGHQGGGAGSAHRGGVVFWICKIKKGGPGGRPFCFCDRSLPLDLAPGQYLLSRSLQCSRQRLSPSPRMAQQCRRSVTAPCNCRIVRRNWSPPLSRPAIATSI